jgi:hypothetical protein
VFKPLIPVARFCRFTYVHLMKYTKSISPTARDDALIPRQGEAVKSDNTSDDLRAGLRLLEREHLAALRRTIADGDAAYARHEFKRYAVPGDLAAELKVKLGSRPSRRADG